MRKNAFTLIELLAVIVVTAIIFSIGIYSVLKIVDKSRMNTLTETALAVKKATNLYIASQDNMEANIIELDMSPGAENAYLMDLGKDPWGETYKSVKAIIAKSNNEYVINIYLSSKNGCFILKNNDNQLTADLQCLGSSQALAVYNPVADWRVVLENDHSGSLYDPVTSSYATLLRTTAKTIYDPIAKKLYDVPAGKLAVRPYASSKPGAGGYEATIEDTRTNIALNSSFETDSNADGLADNLTLTGVFAGEVYSLSNDSLHGAKSQKISKSTPSAGIIGQSNTDLSITPKAGETYTFSIWVKGENVSGSASGNDFGIYIDALKVGGGSWNNPPSLAAPVGTFGWTRLVRTFTFTSDIENLKFWPIFRNKTGTVWFDAMQIEKAGTTTSYIPTTTTPVTRNADVLTIPTTGWLANKGTWSVVATLNPWNDTKTTGLIEVGTTASPNSIAMDKNASDKIRMFVYDNAGVVGTPTQTNISGSSAQAIIGRYSSTDQRLFVDGVGTTPATGRISSNLASTARVGYRYNSINASIHRITIYDNALSDAQMILLSNNLVLGTSN